MLIAVYTNDLNPDNIHLMPWRMVVEVVAGMREAGHEAVVLSGCPEMRTKEWYFGAVPICPVSKSRTDQERDTLLEQIQSANYDVLYWPFAWWGAGKTHTLFRQLHLHVIGYIPGARYVFRSVLRAIPSIGVYSLLPYLMQSIYSNGRLVRGMKWGGVESVITMTHVSRRALINGGWPEERLVTVAPGKSPLVTSETDAPVFRRVIERVGSRPFFLFLGPPTPIRGINQLIGAFSQVAASNKDARLVCLLRADSNVDIHICRRNIERLGLGERVQCIWESVTRGELAAFLDACYAVVLPFLLIPSEIPLAIIEAIGQGKPVITTGSGGTGQFVEPFGFSCRSGDTADIAKAMRRLLEDRRLYEEKCCAARRVFMTHPTWRDVSQAWLEAIPGYKKTSSFNPSPKLTEYLL